MSPGLRLLAGAGAVLALVTAGVLASVAIPTPHPGGDNAGYLTLAHSLVQGTGYTELWDPEAGPHVKYPPVLPLVLGGLMALGVQSWFTFKLLVAASAISLAVLLTYVWASHRREPIFGGVVALLVLFSAGWLQASRWILSEPLFLVFTLGGLVAAERALAPARSGAADEAEGRAGTRPAVPRPGSVGEGGLRRMDLSGSGASPLWIGLAAGLAILAFFTRSAGLPLVVALVAALLLARRFQLAASVGGGFAVLAGAWLLRARRGGEGAYQDEFWMVNPYDPELGTVGIPGLLARVWTNLRLYVTEVLPGEWWGGVESPVLLGAAGVILMAVAGVGWLRRVRRAPGSAELFVPLYLGLILLWPEVWSGDRFLLPLYPFLLFYAGEVVWDLGARWGRGTAAAAASAGFLALALPALAGWMEVADDAAACRRAATTDVFRCHGRGVAEFRDAAAWAGANLPEGSVVVNRKPRIFFLLGGTPGRTFPFTRDPGDLLAEADAIGARYLLLDHVDGIAGYYLPPLIQARPLAFCHMRGWGGGEGGPGTDLFGILPREERRVDGDIREMRPCPGEYRRTPPVEPRIEGLRIPILASDGRDGGDPGVGRSPE